MEQNKIETVMKSLANDLYLRLRKKRYNIFRHPTQPTLFVFVDNDKDPLRIDFYKSKVKDVAFMYITHRSADIRDKHDIWLSIVDVIDGAGLYYRYEPMPYGYDNTVSYYLIPRKVEPKK